MLKLGHLEGFTAEAVVAVVRQSITSATRAQEEMEPLASQSSQHISEMDTYAILSNEGGWLVNLVLWDGNLETWQPPEGTTAVLSSEVDFQSLPPNPNNE